MWTFDVGRYHLAEETDEKSAAGVLLRTSVIGCISEVCDLCIWWPILHAFVRLTTIVSLLFHSHSLPSGVDNLQTSSPTTVLTIEYLFSFYPVLSDILQIHTFRFLPDLDVHLNFYVSRIKPFEVTRYNTINIFDLISWLFLNLLSLIGS